MDLGKRRIEKTVRKYHIVKKHYSENLYKYIICIIKGKFNKNFQNFILRQGNN